MNFIKQNERREAVHDQTVTACCFLPTLPERTPAMFSVSYDNTVRLIPIIGDSSITTTHIILIIFLLICLILCFFWRWYLVLICAITAFADLYLGINYTASLQLGLFVYKICLIGNIIKKYLSNSYLCWHFYLRSFSWWFDFNKIKKIKMHFDWSAIFQLILSRLM